MTEPYRIVTVCTGNICRSPMAERMIQAACTAAGVNVEVDSAGITEWEVGNPIDPRAAATLAEHNIPAAGHTARVFEPSWFHERDLIMALDTDHLEHLQAAAPDSETRAKVRMLRSFDPAAKNLATEEQGIADPWFGDAADFAETWDQIEAALNGIVAHVRG